MTRTLLLLLAFLSLTLGLPAQKNPDEGEAAGTTTANEQGTLDITSKGDGIGEIAGKAEPPGVRADLPRFCDLITSVRPAVVAPGSTATLFVVAILKGDGVIPSAQSVKFEYDRQQGVVTIGEPSYPAPRPAKLAAAFRGQSVFEDTMSIAFPISVPAGTPFGNYKASMRVSVGLQQARDAMVLGDLVQGLTVNLNVGPGAQLMAVPQPAEPRVAAPAAATTQRDTEPKAVPVPAVDDAGVPAPPPAQVTPVAPMPQGAADPEGPRPVAVEDSGLNLPLLVGGAFVLLLLVVLLTRRRG